MKSAVALLGVFLLGAPTSQAATVAFGSYLNEIYAVDSARDVAARLGVETRLVPADVNGQRYIRILGPSGLTDAGARELIGRANSAGIGGVWFVAEPAVAFSTATAPARGAPAFPAATASAPLTTPVSPPQIAARTMNSLPSPSPSPSAAVTQRPASNPAAAPSGQRRALVRDDAEVALQESFDVPEQQLLTSVGVADGIAIDIPGFTEAEIAFKLDGVLNERVWATVPGYDEMTVVEPDTLEKPRHRTVIRYFYTEKALYVSMFAEQPPETLIERLSSRDDYFSRDGMSITLDTSGESLYGYWFSVNLGGTLADGKIAPERQYSKEWDGPWDGATSRHELGWSAEMVLPWSMMSMPSTPGVRTIGVYVSRLVGYLDERFGFPALPSTGARFMSAMQPLALSDVRPKRQLDFYPYLSGTHDFMFDEAEAKAGVDVFWRPSTNLQLSATLNPDFGAVESDDVVVNLTSTETFFPEKRLFFLEGNEIFATTPRSVASNRSGITAGSRRTTRLFQPEPTQIVNTRRIGGAADIEIPDNVTVPGAEQSRPTDLLGALKLTGQAGGLRYGFLGAAEDDVQLRGTDAAGEDVLIEGDGREFGVIRGLYEHSARDRKSVGYIGTHVNKADYTATVHGLDGHYLNGTGKLQLDLQLLGSDVADEVGYGAMLDFNYTQRRGLLHTVKLDALDDKLNVDDLGFLRRNDDYGGFYSLSYTKSQGLKRLRSFRFNFLSSYWENGDGQRTRSGVFFRNAFTFKNLFELRTEVDYFPTRWDDLESEGNGAYRVSDRFVTDVAFGTDASKTFAFSGRVGARQEELGGWTYNTAVGVTVKPNDRFSLDLDLNFSKRDGWLIHRSGRDFSTYSADDFQPRLAMDVFLSARQQFRLTMQYAGIQAEEQDGYVVPVAGGYLIPVPTDPDSSPNDFVVNRMTMQFRYRWQIAPLSDLFVVYTRGANAGGMIDDGYDTLFSQAFRNPVIDFFVVKLRYRFGA